MAYADMTSSELQVSDFLDELGLRWIFQAPVFVFDDKNRPRVWAPDFYIPMLGVYIEVCGSKNFDYEFREKTYKENNIPVIFLHFYKKKLKWQFYIAQKIKEIEEQRHFEAMKIIDKIKYDYNGII